MNSKYIMAMKGFKTYYCHEHAVVKILFPESKIFL